VAASPPDRSGAVVQQRVLENGKALADEVARRWPKTRVLFMSGYSEDVITHHGRLDAGVRLLSKPFRMTALATTIREAFDEEARTAARLAGSDAGSAEIVRQAAIDVVGADWRIDTIVDPGARAGTSRPAAVNA
jgi:FixJ family two-component response regulator